jgi:Protein of unknown function (DUF1566)
MNRCIGGTLAAMALAASVTSHAACNLDIDANGQVGATTDGLLVLRYMLGFRGAALINGVVGVGAARTSAAEIEALIANPCAQAGWVGRSTGRLNDSGVTWGGSYPSGNSTGCTGNQIAQQDCSKGRDANTALNGNSDGRSGFSFTKISNSGAPLPASAVFGSGSNDWACTYDNVTGLMWEVKTTSGLRSLSHTYTWYSTDSSNNAGAQGTADGGVCAISGTCDTEGFVATVNLVGLCGHSDWRVPHLKELESLLDFGSSIASIDVGYLPNTLASTYWSSSPYAADSSYPWNVSFGLNASFYAASPGQRNSVRLVRLVRNGL